MQESTREQILQKLKKRISQGEWKSGEKLPPIRNLADQYTASTTTIHEVLRKLAEKKILHPVGRSRIRYHVPSPEGLYDIPSRPKPSPQTRVYTALEKDLLENKITDRTGRLSSAKILTKRYGTSLKTLRVVKQKLLQKGVIQKGGRYWIKVQSAHGVEKMKVNILLRPGQFAPPTKPHENIQSILEHELYDAGLVLQHPVTAYGPRKRALADFPKNPVCIFHCHSARINDWNSFYRSINNLPVIYINVHPSLLNQPLPSHHTGIYPDEKHAGKTVALHLANNGHQKIAFFYRKGLEREIWLRERVDGIREFFSGGVSSSGELHLVPIDSFPSQVEEFGPLVHPRKDTRQCLKKVFPQPVVSHFLRPLYEAANNGSLYEEVVRNMDELCKKKGVTACVFMNDMMAYMGLRYLESRRSLKKISLIGFDNSPASAQIGLTSYDYNMPLICKLAVQSYLQPKTINRVYGRQIPSKGMLMVRDSSSGR